MAAIAVAPWTRCKLMKNVSDPEVERVTKELHAEAFAKGYDPEKVVMSMHMHLGFCLMFASAFEAPGQNLAVISNDDAPG